MGCSFSSLIFYFIDGGWGVRQVGTQASVVFLLPSSAVQPSLPKLQNAPLSCPLPVKLPSHWFFWIIVLCSSHPPVSQTKVTLSQAT